MLSKDILFQHITHSALAAFCLILLKCFETDNEFLELINYGKRTTGLYPQNDISSPHPAIKTTHFMKKSVTITFIVLLVFYIVVELVKLCVCQCSIKNTYLLT